MHSNNISRIEKVAKGLGSINEEVVYVGGSVAEFYVIDFDIQMGKNAGTRTCGVTYGNGSRESLSDADRIIDDFGKLLNILS